MSHIERLSHSGNRRLKPSCLTLILFAISIAMLSITVIWFLFFSVAGYSFLTRRPDLGNKLDVGYAFLEAMRVNDLDTARKISDSNTWPEIEGWMEVHEIPPCKRIIYPLLIAGNGSFYFGCSLDGGGGFRSSLEGAEFVKDSDGQFKIIDWEAIIERYD